MGESILTKEEVAFTVKWVVTTLSTAIVIMLFSICVYFVKGMADRQERMYHEVTVLGVQMAEVRIQLDRQERASGRDRAGRLRTKEE